MAIGQRRRARRARLEGLGRFAYLYRDGERSRADSMRHLCCRSRTHRYPVSAALFGKATADGHRGTLLASYAFMYQIGGLAGAVGLQILQTVRHPPLRCPSHAHDP